MCALLAGTLLVAGGACRDASQDEVRKDPVTRAPRAPDPTPTPAPSASVSTPDPGAPVTLYGAPPMPPPVASGSVGRSPASVVSENRAALKRCLDTALTTDPDAGGKATVEIKVGAGGEVTDAKAISSTMKPKSMETCVVGVFKGMKFDPPDGGSTVIRVPVVLVPAK